MTKIKFTVKKYQTITARPLKHGWDTREKFRFLLKESGLDVTMVEPNCLPATKLELIVNDTDIDLVKLSEMIHKSEAYGLQANKYYDEKEKRSKALGEEFEKELKSLGKEVVMVWSLGKDIHSLDEVAIKGEALISSFYWQKKKSIEQKFYSPTWRQLAHLCNEMLSKSRPGDHIFFEGIYKADDYKGLDNVYRFSMGS